MTVQLHETYMTRVFTAPAADSEASPLLRALHDELCRGLHASGFTMCGRAEEVLRRWLRDGQPEPVDLEAEPPRYLGEGEWSDGS